MPLSPKERTAITHRVAELRVAFYGLDVQSDASAEYSKWKHLLDEIRRLERQLHGDDIPPSFADAS